MNNPFKIITMIDECDAGRTLGKPLFDDIEGL